MYITVFVVQRDLMLSVNSGEKELKIAPPVIPDTSSSVPIPADLRAVDFLSEV